MEPRQLDAFAPENWAREDAGTGVDGTHRIPVRAHLRRVKGEAPPDGAARKREALDRHVEDTAKSLALAYIRNELRKLHARLLRPVSADDAARILHEWAECPPEVRALKTKAFLGAVFRKGWVHVSYTKSTRPSNNRCLLQTWKPDDNG